VVLPLVAAKFAGTTEVTKETHRDFPGLRG
jgi:hypothetical protein